MRLLKLNFQNLNSLVGTWSIDFDAPAYRNEGIFAISGPTGAGKSTLLDAICLALYKQSPRLGREIGELMSRGTAECFAELSFEVKGRIFTARFSQHRAGNRPDKELQGAKWTLSENDRIIAEKSQVKTEIEAILGLDFVQFTRAILLAQGNFAAFLKAEPKEQAELLEKMTGTEIYQRIGEEIHSIVGEKRAALDRIGALIGNHKSISDDELDELQSSLKAKAGQIASFEAELERIQQQMNWLDQLAASLEDCTRLESAAAAARLAERSLQEELAPRLLLDSRSHHLDLAAMASRHRQDAWRKLIEDRDRAARETLAARNALIDAQSALLKSEEEIQELKTRTDRERQELQILRELIREENHVAQELQVQEIRHCKAEEARKLARDAMEAAASAHKTLAEEEETIGRHLAAQPADASLPDQIPLIENHFRNWQAAAESSMQAESLVSEAKEKARAAGMARRKSQEELEKLDSLLRPLQEKWESEESLWQGLVAERPEARIREELESLRGQISGFKELESQALARLAMVLEEAQLQRRLEELDRLLTEIEVAAPLQKKLIDEKGLAIEREQERKILLDRIASLEAQRQTLRSGQPCPLCGSEEHPYALKLPPKPAEDKIRQLKTEHREEGRKLETLHLRRTEALTEAKINRERLELLARNIAQLPSPDLDALRRQRLRSEEQAATLLDELKTLLSRRNGLEELRPRLAKSREDFALAKEKFAAAEHQSIAAATSLRLAEIAQDERTLRRQEQERELLAALAPFLPSVEAQDLGPALLESLSQRSRRRQQMASRQQALALLLATSSEQLSQTRDAFEKNNAELAEISLALSDTRLRLERRRRDRLARFAEKSPDAEEIHISRLLAAGELRHQGAIRSHAEAAAIAEISAKSAADLAALHAAGEAAFLDAEAAWQVELLAAGFADEEARLAAQLTPVQRQAAESRLKEAGGHLASLISLLETAKEKLASLKQQEWPERSRDELARSLSSVRSAVASLLQQQGAESEKLKAEEAARERHALLLAQLAEAQADLAPWQNLKDCIGTIDGLKRFAQGLTLERLLALANQHLLLLRPRYRLTRENEVIRILDSHHADTLRPVTNLSGGESVLISLALALGLSDMASRRIDLGCLFLDEGFGALDGESLQQALDALSHLQQHSGKLIGLISHVDSLKESLPVQIKVTPLGRGRSVISGPGVVQIAAAVEKPSRSRAVPRPPDTHAKVMRLLGELGSLKSSLLQERLGLSPSQAGKVLKELLGAGVLRLEGRDYLAATQIATTEDE
ncbi:MAG: hypothetical protein RL095_2545 [Verrucomicrobiota bacterium]|jgi:exonuclease SbcC